MRQAAPRRRLSVREIVTVGDPVLRERAREAALDGLAGRGSDAIDDLIETRRAANGAGLAANQVGVAASDRGREVVGTNPRYPYKPPIPLTVMVNPVVEALDRRRSRSTRAASRCPTCAGT